MGMNIGLSFVGVPRTVYITLNTGSDGD